MADEFEPLYPEETEAVIAARWADWANENVSPVDDGYVDTQVGSMWWLMTRPGIREAAREYDLLGTEAVAAALPQFAWGVFLDDHAERGGLTRKKSTAATGLALFTGPIGTAIAAGQTVYVPAADAESDPIEFETKVGGAIPAALAAPSGLSATLQAGGALVDATTYRYVVTAVDDAGETLASAEVSAAATAVNKQVLLDWPDVVGARSYRVFRKTGAVAGPPYDLLVAVTASTYTDTGAVVPDGLVHTPGANTTGGKLALPVTARLTGAAGNVGANAATGLTPPVQDVTVTNSAPMVGGTDTENDEPLRVRVVGGFAGGGASNRLFYERRALDYPGVGRVTVIVRWNGPNTVLVIVTDVNGQPVSQATIDGLRTQLDPIPGKGAGDAPAGAEVTVQTATSLGITVTATVELEAGYSLDGAGGSVALRELIRLAVSDYIVSVPSGGEIVLRQVIRRIVGIPGVHDVSAALSPGAGGNGNIAVPSSPPRAPSLATLTLTEGVV